MKIWNKICILLVNIQTNKSNLKNLKDCYTFIHTHMCTYEGDRLKEDSEDLASAVAIAGGVDNQKDTDEQNDSD